MVLILDLGRYYAILPSDNILKKYMLQNPKIETVPKDFTYNSGRNEKFLSIQEIRDLIIKNVSKDFKPV